MHKFNNVAVAVVAAIVLGLGICLGGSQTVRAQDAPQGDAVNGKRIFLKEACFTCHGRVGEGGAYNGPAPILAHTALPFEAFKGQVRNPINDMPAYSSAILSDKDIADIYTFVHELPGPTAPKNFPILNN